MLSWLRHLLNDLSLAWKVNTRKFDYNYEGLSLVMPRHAHHTGATIDAVSVDKSDLRLCISAEQTSVTLCGHQICSMTH